MPDVLKLKAHIMLFNGFIYFNRLCSASNSLFRRQFSDIILQQATRHLDHNLTNNLGLTTRNLDHNLANKLGQATCHFVTCN